MAVTLNKPRYVGMDSWQVSWTSTLTDATYYVYRDGELLYVTKVNQATFMVAEDDGALIEVLDTNDPPTLSGAARATLAWDGVPGAVQYRIEENVSGSFVERGTLPDKGASRHYWTTTPLVGAVDTEFRVTPIGSDGNEGTPTSYTVNVARHPIPAALEFSLSATGRILTVSAAA